MVDPTRPSPSWLGANESDAAVPKRIGPCRLEREWEWAARGSDARMLPWGDEAPVRGDTNVQIEGDGWPYTAPVGSFPRDRTAALCLDMAGNVSEWVADWAGTIEAEPATDPLGPPTGTRRMSRGSAWYLPVVMIALSWRDATPPDPVSRFHLGLPRGPLPGLAPGRAMKDRAPRDRARARAAPGGSFPRDRTPTLCFDLAGNVSEWVAGTRGRFNLGFRVARSAR